MDPALLAGVDDDDDNDTCLVGVQIPIMANDDDNNDLDTESDHNSIDPNEANHNSSKASTYSTRIYSTGSQAPVHNMTDEPPQLPLDEEELDDTDDTQLPKLETQVHVLCQSKRPPSDYIP